MFYPVRYEIPYQNPIFFLSLTAKYPGTVLLDSTSVIPHCGRYSFIAIDPFQILSSKGDQIELKGKKWIGDPFQVLQQELSKFPLSCHEMEIPFQGGAAGYFGYDLYQHLEKIDAKQHDDMQFPDMVVGFYDLVVAFDHIKKQAWIFSSGFPLTEEIARKKHAEERCQWLVSEFTKMTALPALSMSVIKNEMIESNFTREKYIEAVETVKEYILAGDIFEANISQRFSTLLPSSISTLDLYRRLCMFNPAPFSAYLVFDGVTVISASPERFLKLTNGRVETRPIKGTRRRDKNAIEDSRLAQELLASEKDYAENIMIVDLLRNDLSRVCRDFSVKVPELCSLESYATVHHLVSVVIGELRESFNAIDLLRATFPGGSVTGAPKIRAMEIIAEIEPTQRGPYCGSVGYIGFNGDMDLSITIRTFCVKNQTVTFQAGGAIVVDSNPLSEYEETLTKANALRRTLCESIVD